MRQDIQPVTVSKTIRDRQTLKVLADENQPWPVGGREVEALISQLVDLAGWAPYHYPCASVHQRGKLDSPAPWRFYVLNARAARQLLKRLATLGRPLGKVGPMLAAADGLALVTWLPDPATSASLSFQGFEPTQRNMEHIAATAAAIQNLLLAATDAGLNNYWSSGGVLRTESVFEWLEIARDQVLLGAIFLFPGETGSAQTKGGANRAKKGGQERWTRWVSLTDERE